MEQDPSPTTATASLQQGSNFASLKDEQQQQQQQQPPPPPLQQLTPEEQLSKRLSKVLKGCTCPIATGGFLELESAPKITTSTTTDGSKKEFTIAPALKQRDDGWGDEANAKRMERQVKSAQGLLQDIPKAAFGAGSETKFDASVRDALQLPAKDFTLDGISQEEMDKIKAKITKDLALETDIVLEPYSLNVYQKGGKFVKHKDTARGDDMLGTLVICLPSLFTGGGLRVTMGHEDHMYFMQKRYSGGFEKESGWYQWWNDPEKGAKTLLWAAFFSDVDHEILKVKAGLRMTVAFLIRRKDKSSASACYPREILADEQAVIIKQEVGKALHEELFLTYGGKLGYPCLHLYINTEVFPAGKTSDDALTAKQISKLKGRDLMVANAAAAFGLDVFLVPYLSHSCQGDLGDFKLKTFPKKKRCPRYMSEDDVEHFFDGERNPTDVMEQPDQHADLWLLSYRDSEQPENKVGETPNYHYDGYFGNEASDTTFYVKAALFIQVPDYSESRGEEQVAKPAAKKRKAVSTK